jgi:tetratricopeptide (TPR) repeat protein/TolB-like protein/tRNA A-37 threonylcarbamoyl transferase component Bud32
MLKAGQVFAQFRIVEKLGEGGMGTVYLAADQKLARTVALKILSPEFVDDAERRARFQREARTAASISHPNVTAIFDIGEADDPDSGRRMAYIVMEHVRGEPLQRHLETAKPDLASVLRIAEKIASGLGAAHRLGILHRDIKPENIILTGDGEPKILDFGLAKELGAPLWDTSGDRTLAEGGTTMTWDKENLTREGRIVGTVKYMSPEQARGEALDTRSDVFSFGILLYRMATGETPFEAESQVSVLAKIIEAEHRQASQKNVNVPPELDRIIDRCLRKQKDERYADTQDLVQDLRFLRRQFESGVTEGLSTSGVAMVGAGGGFLRRWGGRGALALTVAAAAVLGIEFLRGDSGSVVDAGETRLAILGFENTTGDEDLAWMTTGLPEILLTDLAQVPELSLISRDRVFDRLRKSNPDMERAGYEDWVKASERLGASQVLSGKFYRLGDRIRIDARLEDTGSGKILFAEKVVGADPIQLVDSLSAMVVGKLNMGGEGRIRVADMMTASAEAYKYYHQGTEKLLIGLGDEARELYRRALAVDSTFALPYMRIGMSHVFEGRPREGAEYFVRALRYEKKLSPRDRRLLDIYADVWLRQELGDAYTKMADFVETYPEDKEALSLYGALLVGFSADTTRGFAQCEAALELDPTYPLALAVYAQNLAQFEQYDRAIRIMERYRAAYPESPDAYKAIGDYCSEMNENARALESYEEFRRRFPDDPTVIPDMVALAIRQRDFEKARRYTGEILLIRPGDAQWARIREGQLGNLETWRGRFDAGLGHYRRAAAIARSIGDPVMVHTSLSLLAGYHDAFDRPDSALAIHARAQGFARPYEKMSYPVKVVEESPERAPEMRPVLQKAMNDFKAHIPEDLWSLADGVKTIFEAHAARDTAGIIAYYRGLRERPPNQRGPDVDRSLGTLLARAGRYAEAIPYLETALETENAYRYLDTAYWLGRAREGTGDGKAAAARYEEVLRYWGDADIDIEAVRGARAGLARLGS